MNQKPVIVEDDKQIRNWAMACHLISLIAFIGVPLGNILGPLILWLLKRNEHHLIDENGKESLNFQITMSLCAIVAVALMFILVGFLLIAAVIITDVILVIMASVKVSNGESYKYPFVVRLIK